MVIIYLLYYIKIFIYKDIKGGSSVLVIVIVKVLIPRISLEDFKVRLGGI